MARNLYLADSCFEESLKEFGWDKNSLHLKTADEIEEFRKAMESRLYEKNVDSCWELHENLKYGFIYGGNAKGIVSSYFNKFLFEAWNETEMDEESLSDYLNNNPDVLLMACSEYPRYSIVDKSERERFLRRLHFDSFNHKKSPNISCNNIKIKKDEDGNILVDSKILMYF